MARLVYAAALVASSLQQTMSAEQVEGRFSCVLTGRGTGVVGGGVFGGENVQLLIDTVQKAVSLNRLSGTIGPARSGKASEFEIGWQWGLVRPTGLRLRPLIGNGALAILTYPQDPGELEFTCRRTNRTPYRPRQIRIVQP